jgi:hypothetical protein
MVKLNGSQGGSFPHEIDFGMVDNDNADGSVTQEKVEIKTIIEQALTQYSDEQLHNIIINDLPEYGLELLEYRGKTPLYMIIDSGKNIVTFTLDGNTQVSINGQLSAISAISHYYDLNTLNDNEANQNATEI